VVAPLGPIRPTPGVQRSGQPGQTPPTGADFGAELDKALESLAAQAPANPSTALLGDDLAASLQLASQSLQRATAHINAARGYFRGAAPTPPQAEAGSVDRPA
jgi:hypothetical protein